MSQPLNHQRPRTGQQAAYGAALCDRSREPVTPAVNVTTEPVNEPVKAERQPVNEPVKSRTGQQSANRSSEPVNSEPQAKETVGSSSGDGRPAARRRSGKPAPWELPMLVELGELLRSARVAAGLTLGDLGPIAGHPDSLREIEHGTKRTRPSRLRPWLEHLGIDPDPVLERYAPVIAADPSDGRNRWRPVPVPATDRRLAPRRERVGIGVVLCRLRMAAGLSSRRLARAIGCGVVTVLLVEHGLRRPSETLVRRWLDAVAMEQLEQAGVLELFAPLISARAPLETGLGWHARRGPRPARDRAGPSPTESDAHAR